MLNKQNLLESAMVLSLKLAGGLGLEPRLAESESFGVFDKNWRNARILRVIGMETKEIIFVISGFIRHIIVTLKTNLPPMVDTGYAKDMARLINTNQLAKYLGISREYLRQWREEDQDFPKPIRGTMFDSKAIDAYLDKLSGLT